MYAAVSLVNNVRRARVAVRSRFMQRVAWLGLACLMGASATWAAPPPQTVVITGPLIPSDSNDPVRQSLEGTWDNSVLQLNGLNSISYPEGWTLQFRTSRGWRSTPPSDLTTVNGLQAVGHVASEGPAEGSGLAGQQLIRVDQEVAVVAQPVTVAIPTAGNRWGVFFDPTLTKVFSILNSGVPGKVDCHIRSNGASCAGWPSEGVTVPGVGTSIRPRGAVVDDRIFIPGSDGAYGGFSCVTTAGANCATPFYRLTERHVHFYDRDTVVELAVINKKLYTWDVINAKLLCFDPAISAACPNENGWAPPGSNGTLSAIQRIRIVGDNQRVYGVFSKGENAHVYCYDALQKRACSGWSEAKAVPFHYAPLFVPISRNGVVVDSVCAQYKPSTTQGEVVGICYRADGSTYEPSAALKGIFLASNVRNSAVTGSESYANGRTYWAPNLVNRTEIYCYDARTDSKCWANVRATVDIRYLYGWVPDPVVPYCLWTASYQNGIIAWDVSGEPRQNCSAYTPPININLDVGRLRQACTANDATPKWNRFEIRGATGASSAKLTVLNASGAVVSGWSNISPGNGGQSRPLNSGKASWDLSRLTTAMTGNSPRFQIQLPGVASGTVVSSRLVVASKPAELCWKVRRVGGGGGDITDLIVVVIDDRRPDPDPVIPPPVPPNPRPDPVVPTPDPHVTDPNPSVKRLNWIKLR